MFKYLKHIWRSQSGATAIEYGLIVGIMAALLITVLGGFSEQLSDLFEAITDKLGNMTDNIKSGN